MGEVDQFLDEVETELARLGRENDDLRAQLSTAQQAGPARTAAPERVAEVEERPEEGADVTASSSVETIKVATVAEASSAAARLLEIATRNADELVTEAKDDADKIVGEARTKAERLEAEAKERADRLESDARSRSEMLDAETAERRQQMFGDLERERDRLDTDVENLRSFEREYRSRLKSYFEQQLQALNGNAPAAEASGEPSEDRLQALLGEESQDQPQHG